MSAEIGLGVGLGGVLGFLLAGLGGGGGLFLVPLFVLLFKEPVSRAAGNAQVVIWAASSVGALRHWRGGRVRFKIGGLTALGQVAGALGGSLLNPRVPPKVVLGILIFVLISAALYMLFGGKASTDSSDSNDPEARQIPVWRLFGIGLVVGGLSGFAGVGGGFLMVPALVAGAGLGLTEAIGTSVAIMCLGSLTSAVTYLLQGQISAQLALSVGSGAVLGALLGASISGRLPERPVRIGFALLMFVAAALLITR